MTQRTAKSIALEKITRQMTSREATERVLEEVALGFHTYIEDQIGFSYLEKSDEEHFEYWITNVYQPPKSETNGKT